MYAFRFWFLALQGTFCSGSFTLFYHLSYTLYAPHSTSTLYALHSTLYTVCSMLYTLRSRSTLYALHSILCALLSTLYALHYSLLSALSKMYDLPSKPIQGIGMHFHFVFPFIFEVSRFYRCKHLRAVSNLIF